MLSCKQVATALSSGELEGAGPHHRLSIWFHLVICKYCRAYARQIRALGDATKRLLGSESTRSEELERLEERLVERCGGSGENSER